MYYYYVLLDGRGAGWRVVGNALRAVHVRVKFFLRHRFPWKFPETVFFRASQISERISGNLDQSQVASESTDEITTSPESTRREVWSEERRRAPDTSPD